MKGGRDVGVQAELDAGRYRVTACAPGDDADAAGLAVEVVAGEVTAVGTVPLGR